MSIKQIKDALEADGIRELASFFDGLAGPVESYDETYVRRLLSRITVFEDQLVFTFKDGTKVE